MQDYDYNAAAHHESAHAVASYLLGLPLQCVYVTPGLSECVPGLTFGEILEPGLLRRCAIVAAAGPAVEERLFGRYDVECCERDSRLIEDGLLPRIADEAERRALQRELPRAVEELIAQPRFLDTVRSLAHELLQQPGTRKELNGARVVAVIRATLSDAL